MTVIGREAVDHLAKFHSTDAYVLSLYLAVEARAGGAQDALTRLHSQLKPVRLLGESHELEHYARDSVRNDYQRMMALGDRLTEFEGRTLAAFACSRKGLYTEAPLPRYLTDRMVTGEKPYLRPLLSATDDLHRFGILVVDSEHGWFYELYLTEVKQIAQLTDDFAERVDRDHKPDRVEELVKDHYKQTATQIGKLMKQIGADLLLAGGHQETVTGTLAYLPKALEGKLASTFLIDTHTLSPASVREHVLPVVTGYERDEDRNLVEQVIERVAMNGFGAVGIDWCIDAINERAIEVLIIDDCVQPGRACDNCGWLGVSGMECPVCGHRTREATDIIDEMAVTAVNSSGRLRHLEGESELTPYHAAAILRFPVPKPDVGSNA